jgi:hypothetical protein
MVDQREKLDKARRWAEIQIGKVRSFKDWTVRNKAIVSM